VGIAAVANERLANAQVQEQVDRCRAEQETVGQGYHVVVVGHDKANESDHDQGDSQPLRKVLACEQIVAVTNQALSQLRPDPGVLRNGTAFLAMSALQRSIIALDEGSIGLTAVGAGERDVHIENYTG